jgi:flavodoxin
MKNLVVFFSMGGHTRKVANAIAAELHNDGVDTEELVYNGKMKDFTKEMQSIQNGDLSHFIFNQKVLDLSGYDHIFFGTPTYGSAPSAPFHAFVSNCKNGGGKEWVVFATCATVGGKIFVLMKEAIEKKGGTVLGQCLFKALFGTNLYKASAFAQTFNQ